MVRPAHKTHRTAADVFENVPAGHKRHAESESPKNVPGSHAAQNVAFCRTYPFGHPLHSVPGGETICFELHGSHRTEASASDDQPVGHV